MSRVGRLLNHAKHGRRSAVASVGTTASPSAPFRIGCASGFWGDTMVSTQQLVHSTPHVDVIVSDYLSEITMSLLARMKMKNKELGYCPDFVLAHMRPNIKAIKRKGIRVVTNAGGLNAEACANALRAVAKKEGVDDLRVATVHGDDMMGWESDAIGRFNEPISSMGSMNAYFGAEPIHRALEAGADVVITGRCVDSALVTGPLIHKFNWSYDDWQALATASLAGHLIECGAQATGGISTDWADVENWANIGFPIAEFDEDPRNRFVITKPNKTGGCVTRGTISEQLVYEIGDPRNYLLPDVTCDFGNVRLTELGDDRVAVEGAVGRAPPPTFKVTSTYTDGYRCTAAATVIGGRAADKARKTGNAIVTRCRHIFKAMKLGDFDRVHIRAIGDNESYGAHRSASMSHECVLWLAVEHSNKNALAIFAREIAAAGTGMAPGLCGIAGGRPTVSPVLRHCSFAVPRTLFTAETRIDGKCVATTTFSEQADIAPTPPTDAPTVANLSTCTIDAEDNEGETCPLFDLAYARSGDKGDTCNIGVIARTAQDYDHLKQELTADRIAAYFKHYLQEDSVVTRYMVPGIYGLNFVLERSLGGGGIASLRVDPQGKAYAQMLLDMKVRKP